MCIFRPNLKAPLIDESIHQKNDTLGTKNVTNNYIETKSK